MYVRLAFAVAAHLEPEILIVDEVLAVGDAQFQAKCLGKMQAIGSSGRTVIFVSHQLATVAALCTRAMLLEAGQVRQSGNAKDVLDTYRDAAVVSGQRGLQRERHLHRSNQCAITDADMAGSIEASQPFEIIIEFEVFEPVSLAPEYLIRDENKHPVAFCPTGLQQGFRSRLNAGHYRVSARCPGLDLASGTYFIDLMLAESGVRFFDYYECGLSFAVRDSARPPNGWVFTQKHGQGCFSFAMEVALARLDQAPLPA
jgi:lipopolysaccharide transport system ATP-binding protein